MLKLWASIVERAREAKIADDDLHIYGMSHVGNNTRWTFGDPLNGSLSGMELASNRELRVTRWISELAVVPGMRFAITIAGYMAPVPSFVYAGDVVAIFEGTETPFLLCRIPGTPADEYQLVGECYVHGVMDGEGAENRELARITLRWRWPKLTINIRPISSLIALVYSIFLMKFSQSSHLTAVELTGEGYRERLFVGHP